MVLVGGDGCVRVRAREREQRREGMQRGRKRGEGTRGLVVASLGRPGGSRRWPGRVAARAGRVPVLLAGKKTTGEGGGGGLGQREELGRLGWTGKR